MVEGAGATVTKGMVDDDGTLWLQLGKGQFVAANDGQEVVLRPKGRPLCMWPVAVCLDSAWPGDSSACFARCNCVLFGLTLVVK